MCIYPFYWRSFCLQPQDIDKHWYFFWKATHGVGDWDFDLICRVLFKPKLHDWDVVYIYIYTGFKRYLIYKQYSSYQHIHMILPNHSKTPKTCPTLAPRISCYGDWRKIPDPSNRSLIASCAKFVCHVSPKFINLQWGQVHMGDGTN